MPSLRDATRTAGFAYAFLTNHRVRREESDRTVEILQAMPSAGFAYALFNEPQRRRGHRERREEAIAFL
ncbi:hypothetical protein [uncultured Nostoc sp.]|uniref:hypothetical protein n=1 Tax=uncultured Nostoc sp. TaxID=340711 RepID=UPI0035CBB37D